MEAVAAALAFAAPQAEPPPELRDRLLEAIGPEVVPSAPAEEPLQRRARWSWWPRFSAVAVPVLGVAVIALAGWKVSLHREVKDAGGPAVGPNAEVGRGGSVNRGPSTAVGGA